MVLSGGKCGQSVGKPAKRGARYLYILIIFACFYDCHSQQEQYLTYPHGPSGNLCSDFLVAIGVVGCYYYMVSRERPYMPKVHEIFLLNAELSSQRIINVTVNISGSEKSVLNNLSLEVNSDRKRKIFACFQKPEA